MALGTFDFKKNYIVFGGKDITGFANGEAFSVKPTGPTYVSVTGADNETSRIRQYPALDISIKLLQTSGSNNVLSLLHDADNIGNTPLPFLLKDNSPGGTTLVTVLEAWITGFADISVGSELTIREWKIATSGQWFENVGGNS